MRSRPRAVAAAATLLLAGCSNLRMPGSKNVNDLSFAQVQSIHPGQTAAQILDAFPEPMREDRAQDGRIQALDYTATDARGGRNHVILQFDEREVLVRRTFTGAILRP